MEPPPPPPGFPHCSSLSWDPFQKQNLYRASELQSPMRQALLLPSTSKLAQSEIWLRFWEFSAAVHFSLCAVNFFATSTTQI